MIVVLLGLGCGDGNLPAEGGDTASGTPAPTSACERLVEGLCKRSCDCRPVKTDTAKCYIGVMSSTGGGTTSGRNPLPCVTALRADICGDTTKPATLFDECAKALGRAACEAESPERSILKLPAECTGLLECKSGPCLR